MKIARSAKIGESVVLGKGCVIEDNASVNRTIVGPNCFVGAGAKILESHLWEGIIQ